MRLSLAASLIAVLLLQACALVTTDFDYNRDYDFTQVKSYATAPRSYTGRANAIVSDMTHEYIEDAMVDTLKEIGLDHVGTVGNPDVIVSYHLMTHSKEDLEHYNSARDYECWSCDPSEGIEDDGADHTEGTLIIDMVDTQSNKSVWRGVATKHIEPKRKPAQRRAMAQEIIEIMFAGLPADIGTAEEAPETEYDAVADTEEDAQ